MLLKALLCRRLLEEVASLATIPAAAHESAGAAGASAAPPRKWRRVEAPEVAGLVRAIQQATSKYEVLRPISRGAFGTVVRARETSGSREEVAIKAIRIGPNDSTKDILREIMHHQKLLHAHIVRFRECFAAPPFLCIAMEYAPGGDLLDYINARRGGCGEDEARYIFQQIVLAVDYCHRVGVMNRDIKPENTLLVRVPGKPPMVKLCDFGYAKGVDDSAPATRAGTFHYADIWSCGVLLYVMLFCAFPFADPPAAGAGPQSDAQAMQKMLRRMKAGDFSYPAWKPVSEECQDLLDHLLDPDHAQRFSVADIKAHSWFRRNLLPGTLEYNERVLQIPRVLPQSEAQIQAAIEQSREAPQGAAQGTSTSFELESDEEEELGLG